jgi:hypothetical protein
MRLSDEQKDIIYLMVKLGVVGTAVSIPIALWAIPRWRESPMIPALLLTGVGFAIKEVMIGDATHTSPLEEELARAPVHMNPTAGCGCGY